MSQFSDEHCLGRQGLLSQDEKNGYRAELEFENSRSNLKTKRRLLQLYFSLFVNAILITGAITWILFFQNSRYHCIPNPVYSPADAAIEYKTTVFRSGLHNDITEYQGLDDSINARWEELYNDVPASAISQEMAEKLPNKTTPLPFDQTKYAVQLDVFHQLHCLNMLRKRLYPSKYKPDMSEDGIYHMEHCVESLRQSLQCASDVSTIFWEWSPQNQRMMGNTQTTHTCRDFGRIQRWAREHALQEDWDFLVYVPGAPIRKAG